MDPADTPPWFQRVLPVTGLLVALITLGALLSPAFRDQVALSTSRQPQAYVELFFPRTTASRAPATCTRRGDSVRVRFVVASHLDQRQDVGYRVRVNPTGKDLRTRRKAGAIRLDPGSSRVVRKRFELPRGTGYTVTVVLPALDQQVRAHCRGAR